MNLRRTTVVLTVLVGLLAGWIATGQQRPAVTDATLRNAGKTGENWLSYGLTPSETRYSPLKQIDTTNVNRLGLAWSMEIGKGGGGQEATPLFANGRIYGITNWSIVFAIDAHTHEQLWRWDPEVNQIAVRPKICCGVVNRGVALYQNLIIAPAIDGRLFGLDADTGKPVWEARVAYPQDEFTITIAPRIAKGKVIVGVSGGDRPTRGFFAAYDALTGKQAWKFYTVPGNPADGFENEAMRKAAATWAGDWWKMGGGGAVWDAIAYDPESELVYVGTGNAEPWPGTMRNSTKRLDNLYVCSILAVDVNTGELKWHYQPTPEDSWDFDNVQQLILADLRINGRDRKVIMQAPKNGFYYVIDRITGEFISAAPYSKVNWAKGIDAKGRPILNEGAMYASDAVQVFPGGGGAHNWAPMAFNPFAGLAYIPVSTNNNFTYAAADADFMKDRAKGGATGTRRPTPEPKGPPLASIGPEPLEGGNRGALVAWDPVTQQMRWRQPGGGGIGGGILTTAGNLVFQVIGDGRLLAYSADKGDKLLELQTNLASGMGPPITFQMDGKQYVALLGGVGEPAGNAGPQNRATNPPRILVFELDGKAALPEPPPPPAPAK